MTTQVRRARPNRWWWAMALLSFAVSLYAVGFAFVGNEAFYEGRIPGVGLEVAATAIAVHAIAGAVALAIGPIQLLRGIRETRPALHRRLGRVGVVGMLLTGLSGLFVAGFAEGGASGRVGFAVLALSTVVTAATAWRHIVRGEVDRHRAWMVRAFALILAAVTLRLQLPGLFWAFDGNETVVFAVVAWTSWVPNLVAAEWWIRQRMPSRDSGISLPEQTVST